jgi:hypothetical protein
MCPSRPCSHSAAKHYLVLRSKHRKYYISQSCLALPNEGPPSKPELISFKSPNILNPDMGRIFNVSRQKQRWVYFLGWTNLLATKCIISYTTGSTDRNIDLGKEDR